MVQMSLMIASRCRRVIPPCSSRGQAVDVNGGRCPGEVSWRGMSIRPQRGLDQRVGDLQVLGVSGRCHGPPYNGIGS
jgi:hypothetical protein